MGKRKRSYTPAPSVDPAVGERLGVILEVLSGKTSVAQAARSLNLSRNHFQSILHRGLAGLADSIAPKAGGRPAKPQELLALEAEVSRLRQENARLQDRVGTTDRLLQAASGLLQGRIRPARQVRTRKRQGGGDEKAEAEPERGWRERLAAVEHVRLLGLTAAQGAAIAGVHEATVRRWKARSHCEQPSCRAQGLRCASPEARRAATDIVWALRGQVGAESLRHSVAGLSRREAARVKAETLTAMERERKSALVRVRVSAPGVMRGMDGMHLRGIDGTCHALVSADAAIAYRTSIKVGRRYDATLVVRALEADIQRHGAPLVYRLDRARAHDVPAVRELLDEHGVLLLHGPPRCPRFYGQLERQNREHRAWDAVVARLGFEEIEPCLRNALHAVNTIWRRRTLGWQSASQVWAARPRIEVNRSELRAEVDERAARIGRQLQRRGQPADYAERLAIEQALATRGYLRQTLGGWC